jgi:hypothetical protein
MSGLGAVVTSRFFIHAANLGSLCIGDPNVSAGKY